MKWAGSTNGMILVPEPLVNKARDICGIHIGDFCGNFSTTDQSVEVGSLEGVFLSSQSCTVLAQQLIPIFVSSAEHLMSCNIVSEFGEDDLSHKQILVIEDFIAKDEVSKESNIAVGEVEGFVDQDIWEARQFFMVEIVLQFWGVQMGPSELINAILADDALEKPHAVEVWVGVTWSQQCNRSTGIEHLIISHKHQRGSEIGLSCVGNFSG